MCSNAEAENEGVLLMERVETPNLDGKWCRKCSEKTAAKVVLRKKDAYCKECFLSSVTHKFRACLGKSRMMRPGDRVLVGFSGSDNSAALVHLIQSGLGDTSHKRLMLEPLVVFIDESEVLNVTVEERNQTNKKVMEALTEYNFPKHIVPLKMCLETEEALEACVNRRDEHSADVNNTTTLKQLFISLSDVTSRVDMLNKLRYKLLVQVAKILGCGKIFTAESADDLAIKLFTNVSLGRGTQLPFDVGFSDDRSSGVKVIRPLRDISKKELTLYSVFHGLDSVHVPSLTTMTDVHSSIQKLTETFLCELQDGFPSTLSTVFRVADKLTTSAADKPICLLCQAPVDTDDVTSSSLNATNFSGLLSSLGSSKFVALTLEMLPDVDSGSSCSAEKTDQKGQKCCGGGSCSNDERLVTDLLEMLCYGCKLILKNANVATLPVEFVRHLRESHQRFKMKKEIQDFLL